MTAQQARGQRLGGFRDYKFSEADRKAAVNARAEAAREYAARVLPVIREVQAAGIASLSGIARELTQRGVPTPRGAGAWQAVQVARVLRAVSTAH